LFTTNLQNFCHVGKLLYPFILGYYIIYDNLRNLNEIMNKALVEKLVEVMLDSDAVKFEEHVHPGMDRTFTASVYVGIKRK